MLSHPWSPFCPCVHVWVVSFAQSSAVCGLQISDTRQWLPPFCLPLCALFISGARLNSCYHPFPIIFPTPPPFCLFTQACVSLFARFLLLSSIETNQLINQSMISLIDCSKIVILASLWLLWETKALPTQTTGHHVLPPPMVAPLLLWAHASSVFVSCVPAFDPGGLRFFCWFDWNRFYWLSINRID